MIKYRKYTETGYEETLIKPMVGEYEEIEFNPNEGQAERELQVKRQSLLNDIVALEAQAQKPRTVRGATLGKASDIAILQDLENQIEAKRKELK